MIKSKIAIYVAIAIVVITGMYMLLRPPAPKPVPDAPAPGMPAPVQPPQTGPQPIPGVPQFNAEKYKAEPEIRVWRADKQTVETMKLETYLEGVIAQEMQPDWPPEALAAQAITSRTLTLSAIEAGTIQKLHNADVSTSKDELQAYAPQKVNDAVRQAVNSTRGMTILYAGSLVNAIYSSCNGQIGATREESFPQEIPHDTPYFQPVPDTCFQYAPAEIQNWSVKIPGREVANAVGYNGNPGDIRILEKGPSGRILYIGTADHKIYGAEFRKAVGYERLKSTLVTEMNYDGANFIFKGMGWGNGVGLCQWGAYTYAKQGWKPEDIVKYYYPDAEIIKLWQ